MKRLLTLLSVFVLLASNAFSETTLATNEFDITAFKVGPEQYLQLFITDAINESLGIIGESTDGSAEIHDTIELSKHTEALIDEATVIFSYRVIGNTTGNFKVEATIHPFYLSTGTGVDKTKLIAASYTPAYINVVFPESSKETSSDNSATITSSFKSETIAVDSTDDTAVLSSAWTVTSTNTGSDTVAEWISRGAMKMQIDKASYDKADIGTYIADVVVTLTDGN